MKDLIANHPMDTTIVSLCLLGLLISAVVLAIAAFKWVKSFKKQPPPFKNY